MRITKHVVSALALIIIAIAGLAVAGVHPAFGGEKITICHAAGREGTTHFVTLTISRNAVFGPAGHFYENGTPRAGHEQDYFGPCRTDTTSTDTTTTTDTTDTTTTTETTTTTDTHCCETTTHCCDTTTPPPPPPSTTTETTTTSPPTTTESTSTETTTSSTTTETETTTPPAPVCKPGTHGVYPNCIGNEPPASNKPKPPKQNAKPKPPPACPPGKPFTGKCGVQGSG